MWLWFNKEKHVGKWQWFEILKALISDDAKGCIISLVYKNYKTRKFTMKGDETLSKTEHFALHGLPKDPH